jgi:hypothetical protein
MLSLGSVERVKRADHTNNRPHGRGRAATSALIYAFFQHFPLIKADPSSS